MVKYYWKFIVDNKMQSHTIIYATLCLLKSFYDFVFLLVKLYESICVEIISNNKFGTPKNDINDWLIF